MISAMPVFTVWAMRSMVNKSDNDSDHTVGGMVAVAIGRMKLYATGSYRSDVFVDSAAQTWVAGLGGKR